MSLLYKEQFATLESVKAVSECYTPVSGSVTQVNESVKENPSQINKSPIADGNLKFSRKLLSFSNYLNCLLRLVD